MSQRHHRIETFKKGMDHGEARAKRNTININLRKQNRESTLEKKRFISSSASLSSSSSSSSPPSISSPSSSSSSSSSESAKDSGLPIRRPPVGELYSNEEMKEILGGLQSPDKTVRLKTLCILRMYCCESKETRPLFQIFQMGAVPLLVKVLTDDVDEAQFLACWLILNLAAGSTRMVEGLVEAKVLPPLFRALHQTDNFKMHDTALWTLWNIVQDVYRISQILMDEYKFVGRLVQLAESNPHLVSNLTYTRHWAWGLAGICQHKFGFAKLHPLLPILNNLIHHSDPEVLREIAFALHYFTDDNVVDRDNVQLEAVVVQPGLINRIVRLLTTMEGEMIRPLIAVVANIATGTRSHADVLFKEGIVQAFERLFSHPDSRVHFQLCYAIANLASGSTEHATELLCFLPRLIAFANGGVVEFRIRVEATWALVNFVTMCPEEKVRQLLLPNHSILEAFVEMLASDEPELMVMILQVLLRYLQWDVNMVARLEELFAPAKIDMLQGHHNAEVYKYACRVSDLLAEKSSDSDSPRSIPSLSSSSCPSSSIPSAVLPTFLPIPPLDFFPPPRST